MSEKLYHECHELIRQSKALLEELQELGYETLPPQGEAQLSVAAMPADTAVDKVMDTVQEPGPATMAGLEASLQGCRKCALSQQRKHIVFGRGNPQAELVFVGEAPGRDEDLQGYPFVGEAGRLLDRILYAMRLGLEDIYICNVIKCRPPGNRDPLMEEIAACEPFLLQQLDLIKPRMIVTLGRFAAQTLLQTKAPISRIRGHWHEYHGIALMPTFHPAYLLRNPAGKKEVWADMKQVLHKLRA